MTDSLKKQLAAGPQAASAGNPFANTGTASTADQQLAATPIYTGHLHESPRGVSYAPGTHMRVEDAPTGATMDSTIGNVFQHNLQGMSEGDITQLQQDLKDAGYLPSTFAVSGLLDSDTTSAYTALLEDTSRANTFGNQITADDYLQQKIQSVKDAGGITDPNAPSTTTSSSVDLSTPGDARAVAESAFQDALGRDPKAGAVGALHAALNAYEQANPSHTTTTSTPHGNNNTVSSTTSGGVSAADRQQIGEDAIVTHHGKELAKVQIDRLAQVFSSMLSGN